MNKRRKQSAREIIEFVTDFLALAGALIVGYIAIWILM